MASDVAVGDSETPWIQVSPSDGTTQVALEVRAPDGGPASYTATGGDPEPIVGTSPQQYTQRWTADQPVVYDQPGRWVLHWAVTGTGEGAEDLEVWVVASPVAGGPTWTPGRSRVANYIPHRTLSRSVEATGSSEEQLAFTFDSTTTPTGVQVDRLIADGVAWVASRITPMHASSEPAAAVCAAIYAAAMIERSWPNDDQSLQRANDLERRLDTMLKDLAAANTDQNDTDNGTQDGFDVVYPAWSFPPADCRWDSPTYW